MYLTPWIPFIKSMLQLQHYSNLNIDKNGKYIFTNDHDSTKALPILEDLLACHARSKACLSCRRLSSRWRAARRRCAAALAPGPSWLSLSSRQSELARTIVTLIALLISPTTLPSWPGPASQPWALLIAATLDSAKISRSLCRSGERSPQGPATSCPHILQTYIIIDNFIDVIYMIDVTKPLFIPLHPVWQTMSAGGLTSFGKSHKFALQSIAVSRNPISTTVATSPLSCPNKK